jgi:hypothetical protein
MVLINQRVLVISAWGVDSVLSFCYSNVISRNLSAPYITGFDLLKFLFEVFIIGNNKVSKNAHRYNKFSQLSRQEIEAMFLVSDIKQTRVYQEAKQEGEMILLIRMLSKRFGKLGDSYGNL